MTRGLTMRVLGAGLLALCGLLAAAGAEAAVTLTPSAQGLYPNQSATITVGLSGLPILSGGTGVLAVTGLPAGVTTAPAAPTYTKFTRLTTATTSFQLNVGAGATPGAYTLTVSDQTFAAGSATFALTVFAVGAGPDFTLAATPNPITIRQGQTGNVVISLNPLNGFAGTASVTIPAIQSITALPNAFTIGIGKPTTVAFTVAANAAPGTYTAPVNGASAGVPGTRTVNVSIVVPPPPDYTLTANPATLSLTQGGTGKITFTMTALNGWNLPTLLTIPPIPNVTAAPTTGNFPGTGGSIDVFFTASAAAPNGALTFTATASTDPAGNVLATRSANATIVIQPPSDFSLSVTPLALRLQQTDTGPVTVTANPLYGFAGTVNVVAPAVAGLTFNPASFTLAAGASRVVQVTPAAGFPPGTTTQTFSGTSGGIAGARTASFSLTVDPKPDFALVVQPPSVTLAPLGTTQVTVTVQGLNNLTGSVDVAAPTTLQGIAFNPPTATIPVGGSRTFDVTAAANASGTAAGSFTGTAAGVSGSRAATFSVSITAAPDFQVVLTPPALVLPPGAAGSSSVSIVPINGFGGTFNVTVAPPAGITVTPLSFPAAPNAPVPLNVTVGPGLSGVFDIPVSATATQLPLTHAATLRVTVPAPDYALTLSPSSLRLAPGGSSSVAVTAVASNGFAGVVTVVPVLPPGVDVDLKSFTLAPGQSRFVNVSLAAGTAGFLSVPFNGTTPGGPSRSVTLPIAVETAPDFTLSVTPAVINLPAGGRAPAQVTLIPLNGWSGGVDVTASGSSGISIAPPTFPLQPGVPYPVEIRAADDAPPGAVTLFFRASGANGGTGVTVTRTVNVQVTIAQADFNVRVTPPAPTVIAGRTTDLSFVLEPLGAFAGTATLTPVSLPPGVTLSPPQPLLAPNVPQAATLFVPRALTPGTYTLVFRADEVPSALARRRPLLISKSVTLPLVVQAARGGFTVTVSPSTVLASPGQPVAVRYELRNLGDAPLTITGDTYVLRSQSGVGLGSVEEPLSVVLPPRGTAVVSNTVLVTGEQFAQAGAPPVVLADRTFRAVPDETGYIPNATATVTATAANSLLATASATRISIVYPPSGTLVGRGNALRAQGLVVGSGTGNLLVGWFYDGVLVETATVPLQNGTAASVSNAITLPTLVSGNHEISLAVLAPNTLSSPPVQIYVEEGLQTLRLLSPSAGAVLAPAFGAPTFSWIPVPGVARYGVGMRRRVPGAQWRWEYTTDTRWSPPAGLWNSLAEGEYEWGVRGFTNTGRVSLDSQTGGASAPSTAEGTLDMAEGWTVSSAQGRFSIGGSEAALQDLHGQATADAAGVRFVWQEIPGALYVHTLYAQGPDGPRRVRTEIVAKPMLLVPTAALPRGGPFLWRVSALDKDGRPLGAMAAAPVPAGGAR